MARRIIWTHNTNSDLRKLIIYLKEEWSIESAYKFEKRLFLRIDLISKFPHLAKASIKTQNFLKIVITKQNSLYYSVDEEKIVLLNIFRQAPNKTKH